MVYTFYCYYWGGGQCLKYEIFFLVLSTEWTVLVLLKGVHKVILIQAKSRFMGLWTQHLIFIAYKNFKDYLKWHKFKVKMFGRHCDIDSMSLQSLNHNPAIPFFFKLFPLIALNNQPQSFNNEQSKDMGYYFTFQFWLKLSPISVFYFKLAQWISVTG